MGVLLKKHEQEVAALEASFEAEEARHTAEIVKKLNEEHMDNVQQANRALLEKVNLLFIRGVILRLLKFTTQTSAMCKNKYVFLISQSE